MICLNYEAHNFFKLINDSLSIYMYLACIFIFVSDNIYIEVDTGYKDLKDAFVIGQSW